MIKVINFNDEKKYVNDFLNLPSKIYTKNDLMEDRATYKDLILNRHVLSKYFKLEKFLVYKDDKAVGRCAITIYPNEDTAYLGYYECYDDNEACKALFDEVYSYCKENGFNKIIGPVDSSFWIKYRLKINKFDVKPYTSEPYNKEYYLNQFLNNGFIVCEHYTSNVFEKLDGSYKDKKFEEHYDEFIKKGYKIIKPRAEDYDKVILEIYDLIMKLYSDFPIFKYVEKDDFKSVYSSMKSIMNMQLVRMAYYDDKAVGFYISIPNYSNLVYNLNLFKILKVLRIKKKPKDYVMLYMGVDNAHQGLGKAIVKSVVDELNDLKCSSIGALARDGKLTQNYGKEKVESVYEYVLLERKVNE